MKSKGPLCINIVFQLRLQALHLQVVAGTMLTCVFYCTKINLKFVFERINVIGTEALPVFTPVIRKEHKETILILNMFSLFHQLGRPSFLLRIPLHGPSRKHRFQHYLYCCIRIRCRGNMFTEPLPRNGSTSYNNKIGS
jgi:hypothetical protein